MPVIPQIQVGSRSHVDFDGLQRLAQNAPEAFSRRTNELIASGEITLAKLKDLKALYRLLAPISVPALVRDPGGTLRAINSSAFPILVGNTIIAAVNAAYDELPKVGQDLVTEMDDDKAVTVVAQILANNPAQDRVTEMQEFPEIGASEDTVEIGEWPNGRRLSISDTMIRRNMLSDIISRVNALGRIFGVSVEELTLKRVTDLDGSYSTPRAPYVYKPKGANASLFSATANTPGTRAPSGTRYETNVLTDQTDLDNVRARLASMKDDLGKPLPVAPNQCVLLVPDALLGTASKILTTENVIGSAYNDINEWGPRGRFAGVRLLSSSRLDVWSTSAWYFGMPKRQFRRKWALRMRSTTLGETTESYLRQRIAFQASVDWNVEVGAVDYVYWVQSLTSTTPPTPTSDG